MPLKLHMHKKCIKYSKNNKYVYIKKIKAQEINKNKTEEKSFINLHGKT